MIKDLDKLVGVDTIELLSIVGHPHKRNKDIIVNVGEIKGYDYVTYDSYEKAILFMNKKPNGLLDISARIQRETFVKIVVINEEVKIFVS